MHYLGGKARIAKPLSEFLTAARSTNQLYIEPFVGAAWVLQEMDGERQASDVNPYLIAMYKALQSGWVPPDDVDEDFYRWAKDENGGCPDYLRGFVGFACSWGGKWFAGYARDPKSDRNYARNARNSLLKKLPKIRGASFSCQSFDYLDPSGSVVYCDPPYENTTAYGFRPDFNFTHFWDVMRSWSLHNSVFISGYDCPSDFSVVWQQNTRTDFKGKSGKMIPRTEKLFMYNG